MATINTEFSVQRTSEGRQAWRDSEYQQCPQWLGISVFIVIFNFLLLLKYFTIISTNNKELNSSLRHRYKEESQISLENFPIFHTFFSSFLTSLDLGLIIYAWINTTAPYHIPLSQCDGKLIYFPPSQRPLLHVAVYTESFSTPINSKHSCIVSNTPQSSSLFFSIKFTSRSQ